MVCIYCRRKTQIINSRHQKRSNKVWRRRRCLNCRAVFTTLEEVDFSTSLQVQKNGRQGPFLADLLYMDILLALENRKSAYSDARELTDTIIKRLLLSKANPIFQSSDISLVAASVLKRFDSRAWHRYAAEHPSVN